MNGYDPAEHTVAEVLEYLADHPEEADDVLALERKSKNRAGITGANTESGPVYTRGDHGQLIES